MALGKYSSHGLFGFSKYVAHGKSRKEQSEWSGICKTQLRRKFSKNPTTWNLDGRDKAEGITYVSMQYWYECVSGICKCCKEKD